MTMIVPGVLAGNQGPLYYPPEEVARNVDAWNGMPIVVNHPSSKDGKSLSARTPTVLNSSTIGTVFNAQFDDNLTAEAWFDVKQTERVDTGLLNNLKSGETQEVSTGLFLDQKMAENGSQSNGKAYKYIATNYRPDHLAILPDSTGACSISDGCGVLNNGEEESEPEWVKTIVKAVNNLGKKGVTMDREKVIDGLIANCDCWTEDDKETLNAMSDEQLTRHETTVNTFVANQKKTEELTTEVATLTANAAKKEEKEETIENEEKEPMTDDQWLEAAPPGIKSVVSNAMAWEDGERQRIINVIVNGKTDTQKEILTNRLKDKTIGELKDLSLIIPEEKEEAKIPVPSYIGSSVAVGNVQPKEEDYGEPMVDAVWNWDEN
ncbi:DUF2213 domain-containing protein [bacterium]|nr:DUF2213 domain-containing protein [bacterium]